MASRVTEYADVPGDTVIGRTQGAYVSVLCTRVLDEMKYPLFHRFVVTDQRWTDNQRIQFDVLPLASGRTVNSEGAEFRDSNYYYIKDMRMAGNYCFFCGTMIQSRTQISRGYSGKIPPSDTTEQNVFTRIVDSIGFVGRFDIGSLRTVWTREEQGVDYDWSSTVERVVNVSILTVARTSSMDKMWVENGLNIMGYECTNSSNHNNCPNGPIYANVQSYYDSSFAIDSAKMYVVGRSKIPSRSCCLIMEDIVSSSSTLRLFVSPLSHETFYDVTGTDNRIILTSRLSQDVHDESNTSFPHSSTIGVRYLDIKHNAVSLQGNTYQPWPQSRYQSFDSLYLYSYTGHSIPSGYYAHACRLKNLHGRNSAEVSYDSQDFCLLFNYDKLYQNHSEMAGALLLHIDQNMNVRMSFNTGSLYSDGTLPLGRLPIADVVCVGNYNMNCVAVMYKGYSNAHIDVIDWGNEIFFHPSGDQFNNSARISNFQGFYPMSLDVFFNGAVLQCVGLNNSTGIVNTFFQRRNNIDLLRDSNKKCCYEFSPVYVSGNHESVRTGKSNLPLVGVMEFVLPWNIWHHDVGAGAVVVQCEKTQHFMVDVDE